MEIRGFVPVSFVDWDGKVVSTVFTPSCNFCCPFCFNHELLTHPKKFPKIKIEFVLDFLKKNEKFLDGVCITGGEPTLEKDLEAFCKKIKSLGKKVKLDTNGSNPTLLKNLVEKNLVDYIAVDIKAPLEKKKYSQATGVDSFFDKVNESIHFLLNSKVYYEFRTTLVPTIHTEKDVENICKVITGAKLYVLQRFQPEKAWKKNLRKQKTQKEEEMERFAEIAKKFVKNVKWR